MTQELKVSATFEYSGLPDYWGGNGQRWQDDHACVFAFYGPETTIRDLIEEWAADDADMCDKAIWESDAISDAMIRDALIEMLTPAARAELDQIVDFALELGEICGHIYAFAGDDSDRVCECCAQDQSDSPQAIVMLAIECDTCGQDAEECECEPAPLPVNVDDDHAQGAPVSGPHSHSGPHGRYTHSHPTDAIAHGAALLPEPDIGAELIESLGAMGTLRPERDSEAGQAWARELCTCGAAREDHKLGRCPGNPAEGFHFASPPEPEIETRAEHRLHREGRNASENPS